jgi:hypothetical protein
MVARLRPLTPPAVVTARPRRVSMARARYNFANEKLRVMLETSHSADAPEID